MNDRRPLKEHLAPALDRSEIERIYARIEAGRTSSRGAPLRAFAVVLVALLAAVVVARSWPSRTAPGALASRGAVAFESAALTERAPADRAVELDDGSRLVLGAGATLRVTENSGQSVRLEQPGGRVHYEIEPGGPRRWRIESPLGAVEVVGTVFDVEVSDVALGVSVTRGKVTVTGARVPGGARALAAGESIRVEEPKAPALPVPSPPPPAPPPKASASAPAPVVGPSEWLRLADAARLHGRPADAVAPLERLLAEHPRSAEAPLAAFTLGRLQLEQLNRPDRAVAAFDRALALGLEAGLAEDARVRRVEALARAGRSEEAEQAAAAFADRYPDRAGRVKAWARP